MTILPPVMCLYFAEYMTNSVDPDQLSDLGLHRLLRAVCQNTTR